MANSAYWVNCIREIRHSVYGRDNRKPIADAIEKTRTWNKNEVERIAEEAIRDAKNIKDEAIQDIKETCENAIETVDEMDSTLDRLEEKIKRAIGSFVAEPMETWYTYDYRDIEIRNIYEIKNDKIAEVVTNQITVSLLDNGDYLLTDIISDDRVLVISGDDYEWIVPNPVKESHIHHGEDYILVINKINGR